jgi:PAS domain S-box-containing protein
VRVDVATAVAYRAPVPEPSTARARITIIGDHAELTDLLSDVLREAGHEPRGLAEGASAMEIIATRPDVILLNPGPEVHGDVGWNRIATIRGAAPLRFTPVLVLTADVVTLGEREQELDDDPMLVALPMPAGLEAIESAVADMVRRGGRPAWDDLNDMVLVADATGRFVNASAAALSALGLSMEELLDRTVADVVAHSREWTAAEWRRYLASGRWDGPVRLRRRDGVELPAVAAAEILVAGGRQWHISRLTLSTP